MRRAEISSVAFFGGPWWIAGLGPALVSRRSMSVEEHLDDPAGQTHPSGTTGIVRDLLVGQAVRERGEHIDVGRVVHAGPPDQFEAELVELQRHGERFGRGSKPGIVRCNSSWWRTTSSLENCTHSATNWANAVAWIARVVVAHIVQELPPPVGEHRIVQIEFRVEVDVQATVGAGRRRRPGRAARWPRARPGGPASRPRRGSPPALPRDALGAGQVLVQSSPRPFGFLSRIGKLSLIVFRVSRGTLGAGRYGVIRQTRQLRNSRGGAALEIRTPDLRITSSGYLALLQTAHSSALFRIERELLRNSLRCPRRCRLVRVTPGVKFEVPRPLPRADTPLQPCCSHPEPT